MRAELLNNSLFLRYYNQWCKQPSSMVFASLAEFFLIYDMIEESIKVCREGLKHNPNSVSGKLVLAKAYMRQGNLDDADEELRKILSVLPSHTKAQELRMEIDMLRQGEKLVYGDLPAWQTVTMAKIYSSQGHDDKAREIYEAILSRDPTNDAARIGLGSLGGGN